MWYAHRFKFSLIGKKINSIELYPSSEGFFAYQDRLNEEGLLLLLNSGIFYEFVDSDKFFDSDPKRISLKDIIFIYHFSFIIYLDLI